MHELAFALWFFLPAGVANVTPIFAAKLPVLSRWEAPVDFGYKFRGKSILGSHKTIRGIVLGTLAGMLVFFLQTKAYAGSGWAVDISGGVDYSSLSVWLGFLLGFGALLGDMVKSFAKRQWGVASGKSWFPFDQLDYIIGGLLFSSIVITLSLERYILILIVWFFMHLASSYIGYLLKLKKDPI